MGWRVWRIIGFIRYGKDMFFPISASTLAFIGNDLIDDRLSFSRGIHRKPSQHQVGECILTKNAHITVICRSFINIWVNRGEEWWDKAGSAITKVVFRVRMPITNQQHIGRCRRSPVRVRIRDEASNGVDIHDTIAKFVINILHVHQSGSQSLRGFLCLQRASSTDEILM